MAWRFFKLEEFACHHCGENRIDHVFVDELDELRGRLGFALPINSGYRCPKYNAAVSATGGSGPHTLGRAADIRVDRQQAYQLLRAALSMNFTGIGIQQRGGGRFIHIDNLPNMPGHPRPTIWSYGWLALGMAPLLEHGFSGAMSIAGFL